MSLFISLVDVRSEGGSTNMTKMEKKNRGVSVCVCYAVIKSTEPVMP